MTEIPYPSHRGAAPIRRIDKTKADWLSSGMNIDERLEALAQTVELLASMHKDSEVGIQKLEAAMTRTETYMARMMQAITRVANVTAVHELRLADHGERLSDLESQ